jgi:ribulose-phosphate 3-epimerase
MTKISASLLAADFTYIAGEVERAVAAGVDSFHLDFMDGHYVPNYALAPYHLEAIAPITDLPLEVHLEIANPDELLTSFKSIPADMFIVQLDTCPDPLGTFARIRARGARPGLGLLPLAEFELVVPLLDHLDMLLLLGVHPGFGGQQMVGGTIDWLGRVASLRDQLAPGLPIGIDGGVKESNATDLVLAGADILIMGSGLFEAEDLGSLVQSLRSIDR